MDLGTPAAVIYYQLRDRPRTPAQLKGSTALDQDELTEALEELQAAGLAVEDGALWRLGEVAGA
jgi:predicted Rossmann fold nucleotide-binding protein DprA/Smf involved in DNA uptake